ncbi:8-oxo-dGTP pyrophosphatase MutT (NUDIX family) [Microvirga lupini]|uniref:8-oxo-dGTP pyrophosphatase MutT (NUDIX family) n=1 Tax=Microvirga lupini TaxID=420324 RepID=A0A7W4VJ15_9HYPH|nr:NUDIX hydrolase [Microvirga lupini]MBB3018104.1 8-oxo-dGTP pyrophosphatase MutT (NUDIX family) [Microvirga lupini]
MNRDIEIRRVSRVEASCRPFDWAWPKQNRQFISENWKRRTVGKPQMFNGRVLLLQDVAFERDLCRNTYFEVDYADFVAWIDKGYPDPAIANGFAMGALRGSDGAYICGVMGNGTTNAGRVYFAAGTPDPSDLRSDGTVDLATSLTRELAEETGLQEGEYHVDDEWIIVQRWPTIALLRMVTLPVPAEEGAAKIRANIARQHEPELQDVRIIRGAGDIDPERMPFFLQSFFGWVFDQR